VSYSVRLSGKFYKIFVAGDIVSGLFPDGDGEAIIANIILQRYY